MNVASSELRLGPDARGRVVHVTGGLITSIEGAGAGRDTAPEHSSNVLIPPIPLPKMTPKR